MFRNVLFIVAIASALAACQSASPPLAASVPSPSQSSAASHIALMRSQWRCGELAIDAAFDTGEADNVTLLFADRRLVLPHAIAASGARYVDAAGNQFWTKGERGTLTLTGEPDRDCSLTGNTSPWDAAKARGSYFRAIGQEPGWVAEVGAGTSPPLRLDLDYGQTVLELPRTEAFKDGFRGNDEGRAIELKIERRACQDVMSGEHFSTTATLKFGDRIYRGCGRLLQE